MNPSPLLPGSILACFLITDKSKTDEEGEGDPSSSSFPCICYVACVAGYFGSRSIRVRSLFFLDVSGLLSSVNTWAPFRSALNVADPGTEQKGCFLFRLFRTMFCGEILFGNVSFFSLACPHFHHAHKERGAYNIGTSSTTATTSSSTVVPSTATYTVHYFDVA